VNLAPLERAIRERMGLLVATGGRPAARERLCRHLAEQAGRDMCVATIAGPFVCEEELVERVLVEFGVVSDDQLHSSRRGGLNLEQFAETLRDFLIGLRRVNAAAVLIVRDAETLSCPAFDGIGLLSDLEADGTPLLQIVLMGSPALWHRLHRTELLPLGQQVTMHIDLARGLSKLSTARVSLTTAAVLVGAVSMLVTFIAAAIYERLGF
jgi:type II secretory pathway predicted ATPase ExeA